ncbi:hypothetical protein V2J09_015659 [Rumex salicifolius]
MYKDRHKIEDDDAEKRWPIFAEVDDVPDNLVTKLIVTSHEIEESGQALGINGISVGTSRAFDVVFGSFRVRV